MINNETVGKQIAKLRTSKSLTQNELGERIGVSFQAVSKWERGETLPDISVLPELANILETTIDNILCGKEKVVAFKGKCRISEIIDGINSIKKAGELLEKHNLIYRYAIEGINKGTNTDIEEAFKDDYAFEAFVAEAEILNLKAGYYVDISDVRRNFKNEHFSDIVVNCAGECNIK